MVCLLFTVVYAGLGTALEHNSSYIQAAQGQAAMPFLDCYNLRNPKLLYDDLAPLFLHFLLMLLRSKVFLWW